MTLPVPVIDEKALAGLGVRVKALEWHGPLAGDSLNRAECALGFYQVWTHHEANGTWFWALYPSQRGQAVAHGESGDEKAVYAAAQADFNARILSALDISETAESMRERAAKWHESQAERYDRMAIDTLSVREKIALDIASANHKQHAAAIRALPTQSEEQ